jgi:hypothetical protein
MEEVGGQHTYLPCGSPQYVLRHNRRSVTLITARCLPSQLPRKDVLGTRQIRENLPGIDTTRCKSAYARNGTGSRERDSESRDSTPKGNGRGLRRGQSFSINSLDGNIPQEEISMQSLSELAQPGELPGLRLQPTNFKLSSLV